MTARLLPTHDGRARVLMPKDTPGLIERIVAERERLNDDPERHVEAIDICDTIEGREVRAMVPEADAFVLSLLWTKTRTS